MRIVAAWFAIVLVLAVPAGALAAPAGIEAARAERARIRAEIADAEAAFGAAERACEQRFAVTDCVNAARRARAERVQRLRQQESLLDEGERRERAAQRRAAIRDKLAEADARAAAASAPASPSRRIRTLVRGASAPR